MYIIAIAWMYVVTLMAATEKTLAAGVLTFLFYGLLPCALLLWVLGVKHRRHMREAKRLLQEDVRAPDGADTKADE
jgi:biotin transporter BioY